MSRFPMAIQLRLAGEWVDVTDKTFQRDPITITRGRADASSRVDPANANVLFDNRGGDFTPRNPLSQFYGQLGRNTPLRVVTGTPMIAAADSVDDSGTSHVAPSVDAPVDHALLVCAWASGFAAGDYAVPVSMAAGPETDAEFSTVRTATETLTAAGATGTRTATFTGTVDGHAHASIAVSGDVGVPVVEELVSDVEIATSATEPLAVFTGDGTQAGWWLLAVQCWDWDLHDQMPLLPASSGTPGRWATVADTGPGRAFPRFKAWARRVDVPGSQRVDFATPLTTTRVDNHVRLFVLSDVRYASIRLIGEVSAWPPRSGTSDNDRYVPVEVAGILRRLGQGIKPLRSAIYRFAAGQRPAPVGYWPCEDSPRSSRFASAVDRQPAMSILTDLASQAPELAAFDGFVASEPLPLVKQSMFAVDVTGYTETDETQLQWLMHLPENGTDVADNARFVRLHCTGSIDNVEVLKSTAENVGIQFNGLEGTESVHLILADTADWAGQLYGKLLRCTLELTQNGLDIDYAFAAVEVGSASGPRLAGTLAGHDIGRVRRIDTNYTRRLADTAMGHLMLRNEITSVFDLEQAVTGYAGETAGRRIERLCAEEGFGFTAIGSPDVTTSMGPQRSETLLDLLGECADADGGVLHETREELGLTYRTRWTLYNQGLPIPNTTLEGVTPGEGGDTGGGETFEKTYVADFSRSFDADGSMRNGSQLPMYQGQNKGNIGGHGNQRSWVWFDWNQIWTDLTGATIEKVELYLYADHWHFDAGGTAILGYHTSDHTNTYDGALDNIDEVRSSNWPKPGGRWVNLTGTSIAAAFANGTAKGIAIGRAPSTDLEYYGYFEPPKDSDGSTNSRAPKLYVKYVK